MRSKIYWFRNHHQDLLAVLNLNLAAFFMASKQNYKNVYYTYNQTDETTKQYEMLSYELFGR